MAKPKYNAAEHKRLERLFGQRIKAGQGWCSEPICVMPDRFIPPNTPRSEWHVPHNEDGVTYRDGPAHAPCNEADGGRRRHREGRVSRWVL